MKAVSESLGVARSQLTARCKQPTGEKRVRRRRVSRDAALLEQIKLAVGELPSYGYRRVWGLLRRQHEQQALPPVNVKRVYRVMRDHDLLLERRRKQPGVARRHEGRVAVDTSNTRWCSDGFEFRCEDGEKLRVTFALDCCDREAISWVASPHGYSGDDVRDVMLEAIEHPRHSRRALLEACCYVVRSGCSWRTLGLLLAVSISAASVQDRDAADDAVAYSKEKYPSLNTLFVDSAYAGKWAQRMHQMHAVDVQVIQGPNNRRTGQWHSEQGDLFTVAPAPAGFVVMPKRWVVERTHAWNERARRLIMHHDRLLAASETWVWLAEARILARRLTT
ncbi:Mobile element protein [Pseudomonas chlororaphis]|uniref:Mobile element protein n=1 Tax=Pseudomonas chlororaphis TaxID=587753 RepID=A0A3G7TRN0_9PSED|nr:Mobile element protein [Pseudomonas chlororaphis]